MISQLKKLKELVTESNADLAFISSPLHLRYFSGFDTTLPSEVTVGRFADPHGFLVVSKDKNYFLADPRYEAVKIPDIDTKILYGKKSFLDLVVDFIKTKSTSKILLETNAINYKEGNEFIKKVGIETTDISSEIMQMRSVKSNDEIKLIEKAQEITDTVFDSILKFIKEGRTEIEIQNKIKALIFENRGGLAFEPIVAAGKNSATPHHLSTSVKIKNNEIILIDLGATFGGYHSDMTRCIFVGNGEKEQLQAYRSVLSTLEKLEGELQMGMLGKDLHDIASKDLNNFGPASFTNYHSLGHGVGMEIHESPGIGSKTEAKLEEGNVITLEPSVYFKNKFGIRIEDLIVIGKRTRVLTNSSKKIINLH